MHMHNHTPHMHAQNTHTHTHTSSLCVGETRTDEQVRTCQRAQCSAAVQKHCAAGVRLRTKGRLVPEGRSDEGEGA